MLRHGVTTEREHVTYADHVMPGDPKFFDAILDTLALDELGGYDIYGWKSEVVEE